MKCQPYIVFSGTDSKQEVLSDQLAGFLNMGAQIGYVLQQVQGRMVVSDLLDKGVVYWVFAVMKHPRAEPSDNWGLEGEQSISDFLKREEEASADQT